MLTIRDHRSGDLFDPWEHLGDKRRRLLDRSWAAVFRDYLLTHLPVAELATRFSRELGRPTKDLHAVVGALILQQLHDTATASAWASSPVRLPRPAGRGSPTRMPGSRAVASSGDRGRLGCSTAPSAVNRSGSGPRSRPSSRRFPRIGAARPLAEIPPHPLSRPEF
jgi:hypothetical protein